MARTLLIKDVAIATASDQFTYDVYVESGRIKAIGSGTHIPAEQTIQARGLVLMPGVIDTHVHFREPGASHKETIASGSKAAVSGGVTTYFEMPNTQPATVTQGALDEKKARAASDSVANYAFFIGATSDNLETQLSVRQVPGIKIYVGSSTGDLLVSDPDDLDRIFSQGKRLIATHSEDDRMIQEAQARIGDKATVYDHPKIRSEEAALKSTQYLIALSQKYQRRLHIVHVTTAQEVEYLQTQKRIPLITSEVCPHHLFCWAPDVYERFGTLAKANPPIRDRRHAMALWHGLKSGFIDFVASDHAPHTFSEKEQGYGQAPSGVPGVETLLPLFLNQVHLKECSLKQVIQWLCERPALAYGVQNKGFIRIGYDADLVLVDLKRTKCIDRSNIVSKAGWSCFEGLTLTGWPVTTLVQGVPVYRDARLCAQSVGQPVVFSDEAPHPAMVGSPYL